MSKSSLLRKTHSSFHGGQTIFSKDAKSIEAKLSTIVPLIIEALETQYPDVQFEHHKAIRKNSEYYELNGYELQNKNASIKPDGGMITANKIPIFFGEVKTQGTNHLRHKEGLSKQSMGNGIERVQKNTFEIQHIMKDYDYMPYIVFVQGSDFHKGSSIIDRISRLAPFNELKIKGDLPSVFIHINDNWYDDPIEWTSEDIYHLCLECCQTVMEQYVIPGKATNNVHRQ
jgi:type II restriction enzyme